LEYGECNVHKDAMKDLSINEGDIVYITLSYLNLMETILTKYNSYAKLNGQPTVDTTRTSSIRIPCKVKRSIDQTYGKMYNSDPDSWIWMEYD
jgi:hypothetical protein